jgi:hypothetical protein
LLPLLLRRLRLVRRATPPSQRAELARLQLLLYGLRLLLLLLLRRGGDGLLAAAAVWRRRRRTAAGAAAAAAAAAGCCGCRCDERLSCSLYLAAPAHSWLERALLATQVHSTRRSARLLSASAIEPGAW